MLDFYNGPPKLTQDEVFAVCEAVISREQSNYFVALAHFEKGLHFQNSNEFFKSYETYSIAFEYLMDADTTDNYMAFSILRNQGALLIYLGFVKEAVRKNKEALPFAYAYHTLSALSIKHNMGMAFSKFDTEEATRVFYGIISEADDLLENETGEAEKDELLNRKSRAYDELGKLFINEEAYTDAIPFFEQAIELAKSKRVKSWALHNLSTVYSFLDSLEKQRYYLNQTLESKEGKDRFISLMDLGESLILSDSIEEGKRHLLKALDYYKELPLQLKYIKIYELIASASSDSSMYHRLAMLEYKELAAQQDQIKKLLEQEVMKQLLAKLEAENEKEEVRLYWMRWTAVFFCLAIMISVSWHYWYRAKRKRIIQLIVSLYPEEFPYGMSKISSISAAYTLMKYYFYGIIGKVKSKFRRGNKR